MPVTKRQMTSFRWNGRLHNRVGLRKIGAKSVRRFGYMKVIVMGAGIIGVTTAWYLAKAGVEVEVIERQSGPAEETSYANAGELSFGMASPWAAPGLPLKAFKMLFAHHSPFRISAWSDPLMWRFSSQLLKNCSREHAERNLSRMQRVAQYSAHVMPELMAETGIKFDAGAGGTLMIFHSQQQMAQGQVFCDQLMREGVRTEILNRNATIAAEPGLAGVSIVGGLRIVGDRTGDCRKFTLGLAKKAAEAGVKFRFGQTINRITLENGAVRWIETATGEQLRADRYVCALGCYTARMLQPLGLKIPVYPVKGYSITLPVRDESKAPSSTVVDEALKVAITRLGARIRVGGIAELAGFNTKLAAKPIETLRYAVENLFPGGGDLSQVQSWTGLRPMTPDGTPVLGETPISNLYLNTGHGTFGWTMAAGSARAVADRVLGRDAEVDFDGLTLARYS